MDTPNTSDRTESEEQVQAPPRNAWDLDPGVYPEDGTLRDQAHFLLRYAVLAPSVRNAQPWSFRLDDEHIRMSVTHRPELSDRPLSRREQYFSLGCAVENVSVAANYFNRSHRISYVPDLTSASVQVDLNPEWTFESGDASKQFKQLTEDLVCTERLEDRSLSRELSERIRNLICEDMVLLQLIDDTGVTGKMLKLREQLRGKRKGRRENRRENEKDEKDEIEEHGIWHQILSFLQSIFSSGEPAEEEKEDEVEVDSYESPNVIPPAVVLYGWTDGPVSWIKCGRVFQRIALMTGEEGVLVQPFHDVMENSSARESIEHMTDPPYETVPLFLFRLGYGTRAGEKTTRLPLEDVLEK